MWVFLAISHQIISTVAALVSLSSSTTQLHFRMRERKMAVHGKTTPAAPLHPTHSGISISCHGRKATKGSEFMWGKYENIFWQAVQEWCKPPECRGHITEHLKYFPASMCITGGKPGKGLSSWSFSLRENSTGFTVHASSIYIFMVTSRMWPPPPNPFHPIRNAIFQENWVNKQRNQDELIIPRNLLSVIF